MKIVKYMILPNKVKKIIFYQNGIKIVIKNKKKKHSLAKFMSLINK